MIQVLPGLERFSKNPLTEEEIEFLKKIEAFEFSDDQKLDMLTELSKNVLREEENVFKCAKEYIEDGFSGSSNVYLERCRDDIRRDDVVWKIPLNYDGNRTSWIIDKEKENNMRNKAQIQAIGLILVVAVIVAILVS